MHFGPHKAKVEAMHSCSKKLPSLFWGNLQTMFNGKITALFLLLLSSFRFAEQVWMPQTPTRLRTNLASSPAGRER